MRDLPGDTRSYNWQTAPGTGYADVRVMVIAKDWRFQTSSDGANRAFSTNSGAIEPAVSTLVLTPDKIGTGESATGTVTIAQPAPAGGTLVTISHNGQVFLEMPANVTIPSGSTTASFPITTTNVVVSGTFQIAATSGGVTKTAPFTVTLKLAGLDLPSTVPGGSTVSGSVALSGPAPAGGAVVNLTSNDPNVAQVPSTVTVKEGADTATFSATTHSVTAQQSIIVTGNYDGSAKQVSIVVAPAGAVSPTPTATATATATATPTATATATPVVLPSPTATATATATPIATATSSPTASSSPTATVSPTPTASPAAQPLNIATRGRVLSGDNAMIGGFIIAGSAPKKVAVRAIGPSLRGSLADALIDPLLQLRASDSTLIRQNDNWRDDVPQAAEIQAEGLAPNDDRESAIIATLAPGTYTAIVSGTNGATGVGLVEVYDLDPTGESRLANISTRGMVASADNVMIGGFILGGGNTSTKVLVRAIGPSLTSFGVANALSNPALELRDVNGALLVANDNWKEQQQAAIEETGIPPNDPSESAIVADLAPGTYTAIVGGQGGSAGVGLIEIYNLR